VRTFLACIGLLATIGVVDWVTGTQLRVFPLYFAPIVLVASRLSRRYALSTAVASTVIWVGSNSLAEDSAETPLGIQVINSFAMLIAFAIVAVTFAELRLRLRNERESSRTDALTELPNRRGFNERAAVLLAAASRTDRPMTLAYIDLDHFKSVNDEHGHATGDAALRAAANVLRTGTRHGDVIGRLGGDEFAALFPDMTPANAREVLERLRRAIATAMTERGWPITASIGAVTFTAAALDLAGAIAAADETMYQMKQAGKNRVDVRDVAEPRQV
jgi:diguanylate cyclase (GGDEF)-like protein